MAQATEVVVSFSQESKRKLDKLTRAIEQMGNPGVEVKYVVEKPARYEQEPNIMYTVVDALGRSGLTEEQARVAVGEMQQAGVIFVENPPGE